MMSEALDRLALYEAIEQSEGCMSHASTIEVAISVYLEKSEENKKHQAKRAKQKRLAEDSKSC